MNSRRRSFTLLSSLTLAAALSGCGFHLRNWEGQTNLPFKSIYVSFGEQSPLGAEIKRQIRSGGYVQVLDKAKDAQVVLEALSEAREEAILSLNSQGRVREISLFYKLRFRVMGQGGKEVLPDTDIIVRRDMSFNETQALAKESEKALLYRDMQSDLVQQVLRRLAALKLS